MSNRGGRSNKRGRKRKTKLDQETRTKVGVEDFLIHRFTTDLEDAGGPPAPDPGKILRIHISSAEVDEVLMGYAAYTYGRLRDRFILSGASDKDGFHCIGIRLIEAGPYVKFFDERRERDERERDQAAPSDGVEESARGPGRKLADAGPDEKVADPGLSSPEAAPIPPRERSPLGVKDLSEEGVSGGRDLPEDLRSPSPEIPGETERSVRADESGDGRDPRKGERRRGGA